MSTRYIPEPSQIDYHSEIQERRVQAALKRLDPGDVLSIIDSRIAAEPDATQHPPITSSPGTSTSASPPGWR